MPCWMSNGGNALHGWLADRTSVARIINRAGDYWFVALITGPCTVRTGVNGFSHMGVHRLWASFETFLQVLNL
jgi:hypothetical protein